jgi:hypothetical protein
MGWWLFSLLINSMEQSPSCEADSRSDQSVNTLMHKVNIYICTIMYKEDLGGWRIKLKWLKQKSNFRMKASFCGSLVLDNAARQAVKDSTLLHKWLQSRSLWSILTTFSNSISTSGLVILRSRNAITATERIFSVSKLSVYREKHIKKAKQSHNTPMEAQGVEDL